MMYKRVYILEIGKEGHNGSIIGYGNNMAEIENYVKTLYPMAQADKIRPGFWTWYDSQYHGGTSFWLRSTEVERLTSSGSAKATHKLLVSGCDSFM